MTIFENVLISFNIHISINHKNKNISIYHIWSSEIHMITNILIQNAPGSNLRWTKGKLLATLSHDLVKHTKNRGTPKSSILKGFSIINHPIWGTPIFGNTHTGWFTQVRLMMSHDFLTNVNHTWHIERIWRQNIHREGITSPKSKSQARKDCCETGTGRTGKSAEVTFPKWLEDMARPWMSA